MNRSRLWFVLGFLICLFLICAALYLQKFEELEPCPLCIFQRIVVIAMGVIFLVGTIFGPRFVMRRILAGLLVLTGITGIGIAGRHVWLQNLPPDQVPECGPALDFMLNNFPILDVLQTVLTGSGECADVKWTLFGFSMPVWTLIAFVVLTILSLVILFARNRRRGY